MSKRGPDAGRVTRRKGRMSGAPCLAGTRITTECIYSWYVSGHHREFIRSQYPHLDMQDIDAAIAFEQGRLYERRLGGAVRNTLKNILRTVRSGLGETE